MIASWLGMRAFWTIYTWLRINSQKVKTLRWDSAVRELMCLIALAAWQQRMHMSDALLEGYGIVHTRGKKPEIREETGRVFSDRLVEELASWRG